ncbi:MAG TPA: GNAT family N-acetyltransferase [Pyrinomonadaceae bacterium]|nr:GNAT family N-acetyltransferase [Pyrinomonadaceae bacterium]
MRPQSKSEEAAGTDISVRLLRESDLPAADHIMRVAFGTFIGLPEPAAFMGDASYVRTRWLADPHAAFAAEAGGELVGSNFATDWGSVGFFGPLTVRPDFWGMGVGKRLMEPVMELFSKWGTKHAGLFTFAHSPKHVGLYQKFGFWPRFLTAIMSKPVGQTEGASRWTGFSEVSADEREGVLSACRELTDTVYEGLDVGHEIRAVAVQGLGETILLWEEGRLSGLAVCHSGPGTEAGSGVCYIKFGAARPGPNAEQDFSRLLDACEEWASSQNATRLVAGANTARHEAYRRMLARGFRTDIQGVVMSRPNEAGYNHPGVYLIDDWR